MNKNPSRLQDQEKADLISRNYLLVTGGNSSCSNLTSAETWMEDLLPGTSTEPFRERRLLLEVGRESGGRRRSASSEGPVPSIGFCTSHSRVAVWQEEGGVHTSNMLHNWTGRLKVTVWIINANGSIYGSL